MTAPSPAGAARVDPVTAAVIGGALDSIADEMGHKLMRMSYSSIIRESEDFGAALTDAEGRQLCECRMSTPLQSGPIPGYVRGILRALERRGEALRPGDVVMHNDPYAGASHGPDVAFCVPVFHGGVLIGFSVTTAHHLDIGAATPGSCGIVEAIDAYAEGLQFKAIKVVEAGVRNAAVWRILRDNIRAPDLVVGDMEAQVRAASIGAERFLELVERYGLATLQAACADLMDYSERLMRDAISALPDGDYAASTLIDGYLDDPDPARRHLPIAVTVRVRGDALTVDLTGTAPEVPDRPINMPLNGTVDCAVWLTLRSILLDAAVYGPVPQNSGLVRPITIVAPEGTLANPRFPAPVIARFCPGNQLADTVMKALAQVVPEKVSAGIGNLRVVAFSGLRQGRHWVHMEIMEGSYGGRPGRDGMDAVDTLYANTRNNPIEDIESHLPLRVERYELRDDAAAAGRWRGGIGTVREFAFLEDGGFSVEGDGHAFPPWGFAGGADGRTAALTLVDPDGTETALPSKVPYHRARAGQRLRSEGPCGGGYGPPAERDAGAVAADRADGFAPGAHERSVPAAPRAGWPTEAGRFALGDLTLESGAVLPGATLSWKSYGTLSAARDNVVVYPTSYGAQHTDQEWLIGPEGVLDPERWFIVTPDMFGNGLSSSPSNAPDYPALVTAADNVRAQRRLLLERFGVDRVAAVYGFSMGGQQAYHWAALFPEAVARAVVVCGSARTSVHNRVFLLSLLAILEAAPEHVGAGRFSSEPRAGLRAFARVYAGWAMSQDWYRAGLHLSATGAADLDDFLDRIWEPGFTRRAAADLYAQATTWLHSDIAGGGDLARALGAIRARVLLLPSRTDLYFPVADNAAELPHLPHGELRPIPTISGHRAGNPRDSAEDLAFLRRAVRGWLDAPAPNRPEEHP